MGGGGCTHTPAADPASLDAARAVHPLLAAQGEALLRCLLAAAAETAPLPAIPPIGAAIGALLWHNPGWREGGAAVRWAQAALSPQASHEARASGEAARANMLHAITRVAEAAAHFTAGAAPQIATNSASLGAGASSPVGALRDATVEFARAYRGLRSASDVYDAASGWA